jgi:hypothetical protein
MRRLIYLTIVTALAAFVAAPALASHGSGIAADKVTVAASDTVVTDPNTGDTTAPTFTIFGNGTLADPLIKYKMSSAGDLTATVSMECKIVTKTTVKGAGTGDTVLQDSERGFARVWIELETLDKAGNTLVLNTTDFPAEDDPICDPLIGTCVAVNAGAVTMCDRLQDLRLTSTGDEVLSLKLATLQAHAFTWFGENLAKTDGAEFVPLGNEVKIRVKAQVFGEKGGIIQIRKRTLVIEPAHFSH